MLVSNVLLGTIAMIAAGTGGSSPVELRPMLLELIVDANGVTQACTVVESSGMNSLDTLACMGEMARGGFKVRDGKLILDGPRARPDAHGGPIGTPRRIHAVAVLFSNGATQFATPPQQMADAAFARTYPDGRHGVLIAEARRKRDGTRTCAIFAPRTISRFDPALCSRAAPSQEIAASSDGASITWRNAIVASGDL